MAADDVHRQALVRRDDRSAGALHADVGAAGDDRRDGIVSRHDLQLDAFLGQVALGLRDVVAPVHDDVRERDGDDEPPFSGGPNRIVLRGDRHGAREDQGCEHPRGGDSRGPMEPIHATPSSAWPVLVSIGRSS